MYTIKIFMKNEILINSKTVATRKEAEEHFSTFVKPENFYIDIYEIADDGTQVEVGFKEYRKKYIVWIQD